MYYKIDDELTAVTYHYVVQQPARLYRNTVRRRDWLRGRASR